MSLLSLDKMTFRNVFCRGPTECNLRMSLTWCSSISYRVNRCRRFNLNGRCILHLLNHCRFVKSVFSILLFEINEVEVGSKLITDLCIHRVWDVRNIIFLWRLILSLILFMHWERLQKVIVILLLLRGLLSCLRFVITQLQEIWEFILSFFFLLDIGLVWRKLRFIAQRRLKIRFWRIGIFTLFLGGLSNYNALFTAGMGIFCELFLKILRVLVHEVFEELVRLLLKILFMLMLGL